MATMVFPDEVIDADTIDEIEAVEDIEINDRELAIAKQLVESLAADFDPDKYHDTYREEVLALVERKAAGRADRRAAGGRGGGGRGARPHVGAQGEPRRGQGARRQRRLVVEGLLEEEGAGGQGQVAAKKETAKR